MTPSEIKSIRLKLNESQVKFALRFGGRQATVSDWETGKRKPRPMAVRLLEELRDARICAECGREMGEDEHNYGTDETAGNIQVCIQCANL